MKISHTLGLAVLFVVYEEGQTAPAGRSLLQWQPRGQRGYNQWYGNQQWQRPQPQQRQQANPNYNEGWRPANQQTQWRMDPEERWEQQEEVFENQQERRENAYENQGPLRQTANGQVIYNSQSREVIVGNANGPSPLVAAGGSTFSSELVDDGSYIPSSMQPNAYYRNGNQPWYPNWWD